MKIVHVISNKGFFIKDELYKFLKGSEIYVDTKCPEGLHKPKWDGEKWIEGATQKEILESKNKIPQITEQQKLNAEFLLQNAKITRELQDQKKLNAQVLLEIANIKKGVN